MKIIRRIIAIILIIFTILTSPLAGYFNIENNAYATAASFIETLESELFKQAIIPILISSGIVFKSKEAIDRTVSDTIDWLNEQGFDWKDPDDPEGPNLSEILKTMLKGTIIWSAVDQLYKDVIKIPDVIRDLIKNFVDENYDEGENYIGGFDFQYDNQGNKYYIIEAGYNERIEIYDENGLNWGYFKSGRVEIYSGGAGGNFPRPYRIRTLSPLEVYTNTQLTSYATFQNNLDFIIKDGVVIKAEPEIIEGITDIIKNPNYDWNNDYTNEKHIPIPIKSDIHGNPAIDENGFYIPVIEPDIWIDVQPEEIPELNPSGIPQTMPEDLPEIDEESEDGEGKILVFLKNIFNKITGIRNDTATIVEKMPDTSTGGTGGIDTSIPTGFEWGDFRHFFDVIFIFIYFIVILILILLKFLEIVFFNLVAIPANADLFNQYPAILAGINYIKNLQVGGLSITVHQAFEYIFLIFFFIFIIKQIRKLYGAYVLEENERERDARRDMKMDYYDKNNNVK